MYQKILLILTKKCYRAQCIFGYRNFNYFNNILIIIKIFKKIKKH